jgi:hypothetical protein
MVASSSAGNHHNRAAFIDLPPQSPAATIPNAAFMVAALTLRQQTMLA